MRIFAIACLSVAMAGPAWAAFDEDGFLRAMGEEPKVKDSLVTDTGALYIGVMDDGTNRNGYAEYVCMVANDFAQPPERDRLVKIIDIAAVARNEGFKELGRHWCTF